MNSDSGGGTTRMEPPKYQLPYLQRGLEEAGSIYDQERGGNNIAPLAPETTQAWDATAARATNGSPLTSAAQGLATKTIEGGFLGANPYLDATFDRAALQTQNQLASQFAGSGRNIDASRNLRSQELNDLATGIYGGAYDSERNRMQDAMGAANSLANQDYVDLGQLAQVGAGREGFNQEQLDAGGLALDRYLGRVSGNMGQNTYASMARNRAAGAVGGAMLGSQAGNQFGSYMGGNSSLYGWGGAALGALAGGWG
jgi:hypothetical protein